MATHGTNKFMFGGGLPTPSLDLNFLIGTLDPSITFARAAGSATYFDSTGTLQTAGTNVPRFDYDPATRAPLGLLVEEARTNVIINSAAPFSFTTDVTVTPNSTQSPDGTTNASLFTEGVAGTAVVTTAAGTVSAGATVSYSVFIKRGNTDWVRVVFADVSPAMTNGLTAWVNTATGVLGTVSVRGTATAFTAAIQTISNGWYRVTGTLTLPGGSTSAVIGAVSASANGGSTRVNNATYYLYGGDAQVGAFPTSYIPTTGVAATRAVESANIASLGAWFNVNVGTLKIEWDTTRTVASAGVPGGVSAGAFANTAYFANGSQFSVILATVGNSATSSPALPSNAINKSVGSYGAPAGIQCCINGGVVGTNTAYNNTNAPYPWTNMCFGSAPWSVAGNTICGHIRRGTYWPRVLSDSQLVAATR